MAKLNTSVCYLYCITNRKTKKKYIGITNNPARRWEDHIEAAENDDPRPLYHDMREYGKENFTFSVLLTGPRWVIGHAEISLIAYWKTRIPSGYNISPGGDTYKKTRKTRKKK